MCLAADVLSPGRLEARPPRPSAARAHRGIQRSSLRVKLSDGGLPSVNFIAQPGKAAARGDKAEYDFVG